MLESPRYLASKNKFDEARQVLNTIAKINLGKEVKIRFERENEIKQDKNKNSTDAEQKIKSEQTIATSKLFSSSKLRPYTIILPFIWFVTAFAFFAFNFEIKYLTTEIYFSNFLLFTSEGTTYFLSNKMMIYLGKKYSMIISFLISAVSYFLFYFYKEEKEIVIFNLIFCSKFGASALLNISSIYSNEVLKMKLRKLK